MPPPRCLRYPSLSGRKEEASGLLTEEAPTTTTFAPVPGRPGGVPAPGDGVRRVAGLWSPGEAQAESGGGAGEARRDGWGGAGGPRGRGEGLGLCVTSLYLYLFIYFIFRLTLSGLFIPQRQYPESCFKGLRGGAAGGVVSRPRFPPTR